MKKHYGNIILVILLFMGCFAFHSAHADILGNNSGGSATCSDSGNYILGSKFTMPSSTNGTLNDIGMWFHSGDGGNLWAGSIYTDVGGQPYQVVAYTATGTIPTGNVSTSLPIDPSFGTVTLYAGTTYWIVYNHGENGSFDACRYDTGSSAQTAYKSYSFPQSPLFLNPIISLDGNLDWSISIWADYTPSSIPINAINIQFSPPPQNGSTTIPLLFLNAQMSNLVATHTYRVAEDSGYSNIFIPERDVPGNIVEGTGVYFTRFGYSTPFPLIRDVAPFGNYWSITSAITIFDTTDQTSIASQTIQWFMVPYKNGSNNELNGTTTVLQNWPIWTQATSTAPVTTPYTGTAGTSTTVNPFGVTTSSEFCLPASDITDLGGGFRYGFCTLLLSVPTPISDAFNGQINTIQTKFPISLIVGLFNAASSSLNSSTAPAYTSLKFTIPAAMGQTTSEIELLPSNLWTQNTQAQALHDQIWPIVVNFLWLSTAVGVIMILAT